MKLDKVWVVSSRASSIAELCTGAAALGEHTALLYTGDRGAAVGCETAYYFGSADGISSADCAQAMSEKIAAEKPDLVLFDNSRNSRLCAAFAAVKLDTCVQTDASSISIEEGGIVTTRMAYGGSAVKTECSGRNALVVCAAGLFEAGNTEPAGEIIDVPVCAGSVKFIEKRVKEAQSVNLASAKKILAIGRGVGTADNLPMIYELAEAMGAELGCSRPVAEEEHWLPKERYIGVSGVFVKPDVYLAVGISGQVQHTVGTTQSKTVFAINKDKDAPIFADCDFGLVADLKEVIPAICSKLKK